jgi:hypothetical protein
LRALRLLDEPPPDNEKFLGSKRMAWELGFFEPVGAALVTGD